MGLGEALQSWPVVRQLRGPDVFARGSAVTSRRTEQLVARTETADRVVQSVCPYCAVGCGQRVYVKDERGRPDRGRPRLAGLPRPPVPEGLRQRTAGQQPRPADRVLYRRPYGTEWEPLDLETATDMMADRVIDTRARTWQEHDDEGSAAAPHARHRRAGRRHPRQRRELPDQETLHRHGRDTDREPGPHLTQRHRSQFGSLVRSRRRHDFLQDLQNSDCIVIQGSNMAECHPVGFQWVMEAKARGAKVIHVDPRFTRTSAVADMHVPLRAGSDIAFLGGIVNYILSNELYFHDYVRAYTNAATMLREDFRDADDLDGVFSGYDPETGTYDTTSWQYEGVEESPAAASARAMTRGDRHDGDGRGGKQRREPRYPPAQRAAAYEMGGHGARLEHAGVQRDDTLQHPRCVFQVLKRHYARYTPELVAQTCGVPVDTFRRSAEAVTANSGRDRTTAWVYSVGWTHHSVGVQYIRGAAIIQLSAGQHGAPRRRDHGAARPRQHPGLHGHPDAVQPAARLPADAQGRRARHLDDYLATISSPTERLLGRGRAYTVSLLKAYWGDAATAENDYCFDYLPRLDRRPRHLSDRDGHARGQGRGLLPARPEPGRRLGARQAATARHGASEMAGRRGSQHDRLGDLLEGRPGDRDR